MAIAFDYSGDPDRARREALQKAMENATDSEAGVGAARTKEGEVFVVVDRDRGGRKVMIQPKDEEG